MGPITMLCFTKMLFNIYVIQGKVAATRSC